MFTKDFYNLIIENGGELKIADIRFSVSGQSDDIDIWVKGVLYKWLRSANGSEHKIQEFSNIGENSEFIGLFNQTFDKDLVTLQEKFDELQTENKELKERLEKAKEEYLKTRGEVENLKFFMNFIRDRDLIVHQ